MYEKLLRLPYFQGMSRDDITSILDKITFEFKKYGHGETIYNQGDKCDHFAILTNGTLSCTRKSPDGTYSITEELHAPYAIEPYSMFGYSTSFRHGYTAARECTILVIDKQYLFSQFTRHDIFTINFLNLISCRTQKSIHDTWYHTPSNIEGRIANFIATRCESPNGTKHISIKMERLASILCETRLNISKALNSMQEAGMLELRRGGITIHALEKLNTYIKEEQ